MPDNKRGLERGLTPLNLINPQIIIPHLINSELLAQRIIIPIVLLNLRRVDNVLREHMNRPCDLLEEVLRPDDLAGDFGHVAHHRWVGTVVVEDALDGV